MSSAEKVLWRTDRGRAVRPSAADVHRDIAAACPIHGVSIGKWDDSSTWRIDFHEDASEEQRQRAWQVIERITIQDLRPGRQPIRKMY